MNLKKYIKIKKLETKFQDKFVCTDCKEEYSMMKVYCAGCGNEISLAPVKYKYDQYSIFGIPFMNKDTKMIIK